MGNGFFVEILHYKSMGIGFFWKDWIMRGIIKEMDFLEKVG